MEVVVFFLGFAVLGFWILSGYLVFYVINGKAGSDESFLTRLVAAMTVWFTGLVVLSVLYFLTSFVDAANNCSSYSSCQVQFTLENLREQRWSFFWGGVVSLVAAVIFVLMGNSLERKYGEVE